jgi:hypothetical protein
MKKRTYRSFLREMEFNDTQIIILEILRDYYLKLEEYFKTHDNPLWQSKFAAKSKMLIFSSGLFQTDKTNRSGIYHWTDSDTRDIIINWNVKPKIK